MAELGSELGAQLADDVRQLDAGLWRANAGINHGWASFLEEAVGGLAQQFAELVPQWLCQVGVDLRGSQTRMPEQDLDDADVHAPLEHVRSEAATQRVRPEIGVETAGMHACMNVARAAARIRQVGRHSPAGKEPLPAVVGFPDLAEHLEDRFGQRENALLFPLPRMCRTICFESTAEIGSVTASVMRKP